MKFYVKRVSDTHGNRRDVGTTHDQETVHVSGLKDADGEDVTFESDLCHLESWAEEYGFMVQSFEIDVNLDRTVAKMRRVT